MSKNDKDAFAQALANLKYASMHGIQIGLTDAEYFAHPAINCSGLKTILQKTPMHFKHQQTEPRKETAALKIGSAVHCYTLETIAFNERYVIAPTLDKRTKDGKAAWAELESSGRIILTEDEGELVMNTARAVLTHPTASKLLDNGTPETSVFAEIDGVEVKCKCDYLRAGAAIIDLKTTDDVGEFSRSITKWGYAQQAAWYLDVLEAAGEPVGAFVFVVVEKNAPHAVGIFELSEDWIALGREQNQRALQTYKQCLETDNWFGYSDSIELLTPPAWALSQVK